MSDKTEQNEYMEEIKLINEQFNAEKDKAQNELAIEKQRTKTEKAKHGTGKMLVRLITVCILLILATIITTWFLSMFFSDKVELAIKTFKGFLIY